jgi:hypothetical protein
MIGCGKNLGISRCGRFLSGYVQLCNECTEKYEEMYPQGWRHYPGDTCEHGVYVGGCGADYMCGRCESGEDDEPDPPNDLGYWIGICEFAIAVAESDATPQFKYHTIFSQYISRPMFFRFNLRELYDYYDPDTTYEEDVGAFIRAVRLLKKDLDSVMRGMRNEQN